MRERLNFWVIGGDPRQAALAKALNEDGHTVHTFALEHGMESSLCADSLAGAAIADCVILPLPAVNGELINAPLSDRRLSLADTLAALRPGQLLCAGRASPPPSGGSGKTRPPPGRLLCPGGTGHRQRRPCIVSGIAIQKKRDRRGVSCSCLGTYS